MLGAGERPARRVMALYLGCPMWGLKTWVGNFFPAGSKPKDFLALYSRRLNTVEGNTTFYGLPALDTVARWGADTPLGFRFCLKFPQVITHRHRLRGAEIETRAFLACLEKLGDRSGPAFVQLPPTFSPRELPALTAYLAALPRDFAYAVEVRHPGFFAEPVETQFDAALREHQVARVLFDARGLRGAASDDEATRRSQERKPNVPARFTRTAPFAFVRFIADPHLDSNAALLDEWAGRVAGWLTAGDEVYFFMHNPDDTNSPELARRFHARLAARVALPPLPPWGGDITTASQPSLL